MRCRACLVLEVEMIGPKVAAFRVAYVADLNKANGLQIPLGFLIEGISADQGRFLGLLFRTSLTPLEADRVNVATWPELGRLEEFMTGIFDRAWATDPLDGAASRLGVEALAANFSVHSSLQLNVAPAPRLAASTMAEIDRLEDKLFKHLSDWKQELIPALIAPVVAFPQRKKAADLNALAPQTEKLIKSAPLALAA